MEHGVATGGVPQASTAIARVITAIATARGLDLHTVGAQQRMRRWRERQREIRAMTPEERARYEERKRLREEMRRLRLRRGWYGIP